MAQIGSQATSHALSSPSPAAGTSQATPILDTLVYSNEATPSGHTAGMGGAKDGAGAAGGGGTALSFSHVLSGLQGEAGDLAEVLQDQPNLTQGNKTLLYYNIIR